MTETEMTETVQEALRESIFAEVRTFEEAGVMTMNQGVEVRMSDGSVFQITVVAA
jgi:actin-like ATPase involved in cell morphogenesis